VKRWIDLFRARPDRQVAAILVVLTLVKFVLAAQCELTGYEATYWYYAQHPDIGYFDHPAMTMWMVEASTFLFGDGLLGIRVIPVLAGGAAAWLTFLAGRRLYGARAGALAACSVALAPMIFSIGSRVDPDSPLFLFWMASVWALAHALSGDRPAWWYAAGLFLGLAMESKYTAIFFPLGVLLFLACSRDHRAWLARREPYLAALAALIAFSPTVIWNAGHHWESFLFQATGRIPEISGLNPSRIHGYPLSHLLLFTPILCLWAWGCGLKAAVRWRESSWQDRLMVALGLPTLVFFLAILIARPVKHHWPTPGYLTLFLLSASSVVSAAPWVRRLHWGSIALLMSGYLALPWAIVAVPEDFDSCWRRLGDEVRRRSPDFVIANETWTATLLGYELRPVPSCDFAAVGRPGTRLARWWRADKFAGRDAVIVYETYHFPRELDLVKKRFAVVEEPVVIRIPRNGNRETSWTLLRARGYAPLRGSAAQE